MPNICVSCAYNPPVITILGSTLREDTIRALEQRLPLSTSTAVNPNKEAPKFTFFSQPDHWRMDLSQHYCDELHKSSMGLAILEALEQEGWRIRATNSVSHSESEKCITKMFFTRS